MTTNIPNINLQKFLNIDEDDERQILDWIASRPEHTLDACVNRGTRWTYMKTHEGIWCDIAVRDNATGDVFHVEQNPDNW